MEDTFENNSYQSKSIMEDDIIYCEAESFVASAPPTYEIIENNGEHIPNYLHSKLNMAFPEHLKQIDLVCNTLTFAKKQIKKHPIIGVTAGIMVGVALTNTSQVLATGFLLYKLPSISINVNQKTKHHVNDTEDK
jgi:hypothetical protein